MTTLTALAAELATFVPASGGAPTTGQYTQAVRDAVADFGRRVPRTLRGTISVTAGTAAYNLPAGFQRLISLDKLDGVFRDTSGRLVVYLAAGDETFSLSGGQIVFYPTPAYTVDRVLWYGAGYPYDSGTDSFTGLDDDHERVISLKARASALRVQAVVTAGSSGLNYRIGDVSVQRSVTQGSAALADGLEAEYADACRELVGRIGRMTDTRNWRWPT